MRIEISLRIFLIIILFFLFHYLDTYIIFLTFIIIHEIAHLLFGILIGGTPKSICVNPLGLSLEFYSYGKDKSLNRVLLFLAGPLTNFIIAIIFERFNFLEEYNQKIVYTNLALGIFNLMPIIPLDGGKILFEIIKKICGSQDANKFLIIFSKTILITITLAYSILILKIKSISFLIILVYLWSLYLKEEKKYELYERVRRSLQT